MKLGIMQPYFLPGPGYLDLMNVTDRWVVFDTPQYRRHSWLNRNRILHPKSGWQYVSVPLAGHARETPIRNIAVDSSRDWRGVILRQLAHYRRAPHFVGTMALVERCLACSGGDLVAVTVHALRTICDHLEQKVDIALLSELDLRLGPVEGPGDWALRICQALGAEDYVNPPGGRALFDPDRYLRGGVRLHIRTFPDLVYDTPGFTFEPGLSVVDALMWLGAEGVRAHLDHAAALPLAGAPMDPPADQR